MFELMDAYSQSAVIKVIGVGGGGGNAVQHMVNSAIEGVDFVCANTDSQALKNTNAKTVMQLGSEITKGLGAGANPVVGREAAIEDRDRIHDVIAGADMLFITAGMGGGTGTGAAPVVAEVAKELGMSVGAVYTAKCRMISRIQKVVASFDDQLTVAVVTKPFPFEGGKRMQIADTGIEELSKHVDSLITIPNEKLLTVLGKDTNLLDAFKSANDVLHGAVQGIAELITCPGLINVDFADVRTVMSEMGMAMMGSGLSVGTERAREAAESAISSPLLEDINISGAKGILVNVTASSSLSIGEFEEVGNHIKGLASEDATVVVGTVIDESMADDLRVTLVATGIGSPRVSMPVRPAVKLVETKPKVVIEDPSVAGMDDGLEAPVAIRTENRAKPVDKAKEDDYDLDYLDIPAFLRRQAD
jgi:cell division protein FtsZ